MVCGPMTIRWTMLLCVAAGLGGCGDGPDLSGPDPWLCTPAECPDGGCKLHVEFHDDCGGQVDFAEILLNGALEPTPARFGEEFISLGETPVDDQAVFWIRSSKWQWGPIAFDCDDPGSDGRFTLSCQSAGGTGVNP